MSFRSPSGPPASQKQLDHLAGLLADRDLGTFREARHRLGLTQRQAAGRFTVGEASELIDRLLADEGEGVDDGLALERVAATMASDRAAVRVQQQREEIVAGLPADLLADELVRRGWCCIAPDA